MLQVSWRRITKKRKNFHILNILYTIISEEPVMSSIH